MHGIKQEHIINLIKKIIAAAGIFVVGVIIYKLLAVTVNESSNSTKIILYYICCVLTAAIFIFLSIRFNFKVLNMTVGLAVLSFIYLFIFSRCVHLTYENDLQFYFNNAALIAKNELKTPALYHSLFPTTVTYPVFLVPVMKLLGIRRMIPIIYNQLAMSGLSCLVFFFCKRIMPQTWALAAGFLICLHPYIIIYSDTCNAELLFCAFIFAAFYSMVRANTCADISYQLIFGLASGILCGIADLFRPLAVIMVIALVIYISLYNAGNKFRLIILTAALIGAYFIAGIGNSALQKSITKYEPPANRFGWNLYVGASEKGEWNQKDADEFAEKMSSLQSPTEIQTYFAKKGIERYMGMGLGIVNHMLDKLSPWISNEYMANVATTQSTTSPFYSVAEKDTYLALISVIDLPIFFTALVVCVFVLGGALTSDMMELFPVALYLTGSFLLLMVMEIAPRYTVSFRPFFCIFAVYGVSKLIIFPYSKIKKPI